MMENYICQCCEPLVARLIELNVIKHSGKNAGGLLSRQRVTLIQNGFLPNHIERTISFIKLDSYHLLSRCSLVVREKPTSSQCSLLVKSAGVSFKA